MKIIPAVDLLDGQITRLTKGDYDRAKIYRAENLNGIMNRCESCGIDWIHVVDLNRARGDSTDVNLSLILESARNHAIRVQLGGGIRNVERAKFLLESGIMKIVVGTAAIRNPVFLDRLKQALGPGKVVIAADVSNEVIRVQGWKESASAGLDEFLNSCARIGYNEFLITNIALDGRMSGIDPGFYGKILSSHPGIDIIASGGVSSMEEMAPLSATGVKSVVVGKAIYEGKISIEEIGEWNRAR